jgi:uncharacterized protein
MNFPVTAVYALALIPIFFVLWIRVASQRVAANVSIGDAGNAILHENIRQHGNFIEWVPLVLILMIIAEGNGADALYLHISGVLLVVGRLAHPFGLKAEKAIHPMRIIGNSTNLLATLNLMICLIMTSFFNG